MARLNSGRFTVWKFPTFFGSLRDREWQWLPSTADDESLSDLLQTYWTNFAKTINPNALGLPNWQAWDDGENEFLVVNQDASVAMQRNFPPLFSSRWVNELKQSFK